jgi:uncharacterized protein YdbL (DUF1318 family)
MLFLRTQLTVLFSFALVVLLAHSACAQNLQGIKASMVERKATIDALKSQGAIGEGNDGYLHVRKATGNANKVVAAENGDRRVVYGAIARKEGTSADKVGRRRAIQLAGIAAPGHWLQKGDGTWYKK